ncbi:MAG: hypothetical protein ACE5OS_06990 [Anaerolineae bacterium]
MRSHILAPLIALVVAAQACCCCTILGGPQPPYTITPSDEAIRRFEERMAEAEQSTDDSVTITITEEEMTSLVAQALAKREEPSPIGEPQVHFRNGRVEVYVTVHVADSLALPSLVAFSITATGGELGITVEEIAVGPLPIPKPILETLTDVLNEELSEAARFEEIEVVITDVQVGEGEMTISGQVQSD